MGGATVAIEQVLDQLSFLQPNLPEATQNSHFFFASLPLNILLGKNWNQHFNGCCFNV